MLPSRVMERTSLCPNCGKPMTVVMPEDLVLKVVDVSKLPVVNPKPSKCLDCDFREDAVTYPQG